MAGPGLSERTQIIDLPVPLRSADRLGANRACLAIARKLLKRSYHTLRELGEEGLQAA